MEVSGRHSTRRSSADVYANSASRRALNPNHVERQSVAVALHVFSDSAVAALRLNGEGGSADFVKIAVRFWKIFSNALHLNLTCIERAVTSSGAWQLGFVDSMTSLAKFMTPAIKLRQKSLTRDTANALHSTCRRLVDLCKHLFVCDVSFVSPGQFNTELLEK